MNLRDHEITKETKLTNKILSCVSSGFVRFVFRVFRAFVLLCFAKRKATANGISVGRGLRLHERLTL